MKLTVLASGSSGNGYLLEGRNSALVIECGVKPAELFKRTGVKPGKIAGCLVSHEHGDHAAYVDMYAALGLRIYASRGTIEQAIKPGSLARFHILVPMESKIIGDFIVRPFDVRHDAAEPLGFIVEHQELGRLAFVTDTRMVPYTFKSYKLDHIMVEANYSDFILDERVEDGVLEIARAARTRNTHMSIDSAIDFVCTNETERLKNVILIHLSGQNSAPHSFVKKMRDMILFANVIAARPGLEVELKPNDF